MMIDVCICTHSPNKNKLGRVLRALSKQTIPKNCFRVILIDNASTEPITKKVHAISRLIQTGVRIDIFREPKLGNSFARVLAIQKSQAPALVFVDDDNILANDFLENVEVILNEHPDVGCFSGKILIPKSLSVPIWANSLLGSLAMRDEGDECKTGWFRGSWEPWIPACTASMVIRKKVGKHFLKNHASNSKYFNFGRKGKFHLGAGEDYIIALSAHRVGLKVGYFPQLTMIHDVDQRRLELPYLSKLMATMGTSDFERAIYLGQSIDCDAETASYRLFNISYRNNPPEARLCHWLYDFHYFAAMVSYKIQNQMPILNEGRLEDVLNGKYLLGK